MDAPKKYNYSKWFKKKNANFFFEGNPYRKPNTLNISYDALKDFYPAKEKISVFCEEEKIHMECWFGERVGTIFLDNYTEASLLHSKLSMLKLFNFRVDFGQYGDVIKKKFRLNNNFVNKTLSSKFDILPETFIEILKSDKIKTIVCKVIQENIIINDFLKNIQSKTKKKLLVVVGSNAFARGNKPTDFDFYCKTKFMENDLDSSKFPDIFVFSTRFYNKVYYFFLVQKI